jgi:hypothetical protein
VAKIARDFKINLRGKLDTVARRDFKKNNLKVKENIIQEFYNHDPKNGPLRYFRDVNTQQ